MSPSLDPRRCHEPSPKSDRTPLASLLSLLESAPALLWEVDTELRFTFLTGAALSAIGISDCSYTGRSIRDLFSPAAPPGTASVSESDVTFSGSQRPLADARGSGRFPATYPAKALIAHDNALKGQGGSFETELNGRDLRATVKPVIGPDGAVIGVIGIALDLTERIVAERALRFSEYSYRSLIEEAPYAICRSTFRGELLLVNRAMTEMLGYEAPFGSELLLRDLPFVFSPAGSFDAFQKALLLHGSHPGTETAWIRRDGQSIQVWVSGRIVRNAAGQISHLDIFAENITEKKRLEAELGQAKRMQALGQLAGGVAHDFNNLLTVISGYAEMLLSGPLGTQARKPLAAIKEAAEKAAALTKQMLAFSRRQVLHSQTVNLNDVLSNLSGILTRLIKENVELTLIQGKDLWSVNADPNEIERVILNLAVNAQDAMPRGGRLTIETANVGPDERPALKMDKFKDGDYVQIIVRDTGIGMDSDTQARAFEPFFTTKQPSGGTGLGLSVVYGVVRQSGGCIRLESEPGVGTTFRIYLPRVDPQATPANELAARPWVLPRGSETILFAEDDPAVRRLLGPFLESLGYRVLTVSDGEDAIRVSQSHRAEIHLLLSDLIMPKVDGRELAARLKSADRANMKVLFISGYAGHTVAVEDLRLHGACFLQKPFSMDLLANTVRGALDGTLPQ
jgi:two-component system cell cycle sensor histidine kinase/response regulator CckA